MKMQAVELIDNAVDIGATPAAQPREWRARVVQIGLHLAVAGIHAQRDFHFPAAATHRRQMLAQLPGRIEDNVIRQRQRLGHFRSRERRRVGMHFLAEFLARQARLKRPGCTAAVQMRAQHIKGAPHGKALQRKQHLCLRYTITYRSD